MAEGQTLSFYFIKGKAWVDTEGLMAVLREWHPGEAGQMFCDQFELALRRAADRAQVSAEESG